MTPTLHFIIVSDKNNVKQNYGMILIDVNVTKIKDFEKCHKSPISAKTVHTIELFPLINFYNLSDDSQYSTTAIRNASLFARYIDFSYEKVTTK